MSYLIKHTWKSGRPITRDVKCYDDALSQWDELIDNVLTGEKAELYFTDGETKKLLSSYEPRGLSDDD